MTEDLESDVSLQPSLLSDLSEDQKCRLTELLDRYLQALEHGQAVDTEGMAAEHPDLAEVFLLYLEKLDALHGIAIGFGDRKSDRAILRGSTESLQLGDFTIIREVGRGGMGVVYEAIQRSLDRKVAIKLLPMASLLDPQQIARFRNEAHAAGLLQHPNIVPVYHVGVENGIHFYAMQLIDGTSLDQWIRERVDDASATESWQAIVGWAVDIASALHSAHETGVVHRDVKPSNLMVDRQGKIWITDFGLARCQTDASLTNSGDLLGTMRYMSPEQTRGEPALVDGRTDVYSLATTLYELLTLTPAFAGDDAPTILKKIDEPHVASLRQLRPELPRDLETVIQKAMSKSRDARYESPAEFAADLRRVIHGEPTLAQPASLSDLFVRWATNHRRGVLASFLVGSLGLVALAVISLMFIIAKQYSDTSAARAERNELLARGAVDRLGSQMAELLAEIPAADEVRRRLLSETLSYHLQFAANAGNDPERRRDVAMTHGKIGQLHSELGATAEAIKSLTKSEQLYAAIAYENPTNASIQLEWSTSQNNLAQSLQRGGQLEEAASYFAQSIRNLERLLNAWQPAGVTAAPSESPVFKQTTSADVLLGLTASLNNLGLLLAETGAEKEAQASYLRAIDLLQSSSLDSLAQRFQLASLQSNLSGLLTKRAPPQAIEYARQALASLTDSLEVDRGNVKLTTQVVVTLNTLGAAQVEDKQSDAAERTLRQAIEIGEQLLQRWPTQPTYQRDMVVSQNHLGLALSKLGKLPQARAVFEQALSRARKLAHEFTNDAELQSMLANVLNNLGFLHRQLDKLSAAADAFSEAIKVQSRAVELAPEVARYHQYLQKHKHNLQEVKEEL